jgi:hypothetical protein
MDQRKRTPPNQNVSEWLEGRPPPAKHGDDDPRSALSAVNGHQEPRIRSPEHQSGALKRLHSSNSGSDRPAERPPDRPIRRESYIPYAHLQLGQYHDNGRGRGQDQERPFDPQQQDQPNRSRSMRNPRRRRYHYDDSEPGSEDEYERERRRRRSRRRRRKSAQYHEDYSDDERGAGHRGDRYDDDRDRDHHRSRSETRERQTRRKQSALYDEDAAMHHRPPEGYTLLKAAKSAFMAGGAEYIRCRAEGGEFGSWTGQKGKRVAVAAGVGTAVGFVRNGRLQNSGKKP